MKMNDKQKCPNCGSIRVVKNKKSWLCWDCQSFSNTVVPKEEGDTCICNKAKDCNERCNHKHPHIWNQHPLYNCNSGCGEYHNSHCIIIKTKNLIDVEELFEDVVL